MHNLPELQHFLQTPARLQDGGRVFTMYVCVYIKVPYEPIIRGINEEEEGERGNGTWSS